MTSVVPVSLPSRESKKANRPSRLRKLTRLFVLCYRTFSPSVPIPISSDRVYNCIQVPRFLSSYFDVSPASLALARSFCSFPLLRLLSFRLLCLYRWSIPIQFQLRPYIYRTSSPQLECAIKDKDGKARRNERHRRNRSLPAFSSQRPALFFTSPKTK